MKRTKTTTREYNSRGELVKEIVIEVEEEETVSKPIWTTDPFKTSPYISQPYKITYADTGNCKYSHEE